MTTRECYVVTVHGQCSVSLHQTGKDQFEVIYGKQVDSNLTYEAAAARFGAAIMHALARNGLIDNSLHL